MSPEDLALQMSRMKEHFAELDAKLADPQIYAKQFECRVLSAERQRLGTVFRLYDDWAKALRELRENHELLQTEQDDSFKALLQNDIAELEAKAAADEKELTLMLLPPDPNDARNTIVEMRPAAGGEEAALFGAMLMRMYMRYAERHGWKTEMLEASMTELGGVKEAVFAITGENAFSRLKYESGVHRVQRIPVTESNGKRQTSTATVAVLPEAQEIDVKINPDDLRIDVYRASGHGGQYINKTDSAVRITHIPSGIVVTCQDEKSQLKNKEKAMRVLRARLYEKMQEEKDAAYASDRRAQVGTGERSERIRTYNFNEGRVTDHRIGKTIYTIDAFVDGDMDDIIDPLIYADQQEQLRALGQGELQRG